MYNPEIKWRFINDAVPGSQFSIEFIKEVFDYAEQTEERVGKDLCAMDRSELLRSVYDTLGAAQRTVKDVEWYRKSAMSVLNKYGKWCVRNVVPGSKVFLGDLQDPATVRYKYRFVSNPLHLCLYLDDLFPVHEEHMTLNDTYQIFFWFAFAGINQQASMEIGSSHVDLQGLEILYGGEKYPIYPEALPLFRRAVTENQMVINHPNYKQLVTRQRIPGDAVIRGTREISLEDFNGAMMRSMRARTNSDFLAPHLNYTNVFYSGIFYRCLTLEMAGARINFDEIAARSFVRRSGGSGPYARSNIATRKKDLLIGYKEWKSAFLPTE